MSFVNQDEIDEQVRLLHASDWLTYIATTGAVGDLLKHLWRTPGASNTVLGSALLYDRFQTDEFLRKTPKSYCSLETTFFMAASAYAKAREIAIDRGEHKRRIIGLAMSAAVATDRPKKGDHKVFAVARTERGFHPATVIFEKGAHTREDEGELCDLITLSLLLRVTGHPGLALPCTHMTSAQLIAPRGTPAGHFRVMPNMRGGNLKFPSSERLVCVVADDGTVYGYGDKAPFSPESHIIYPGSFNPLHSAHEQCAIEVERMTGKRVIFQLTRSHPDKEAPDDDDVARRVNQFAFRWPVMLLDSAGLYIEKARRHPGYGMMLGADAVYGLLNPKYYGGQQGMLDVMKEFERLGTTFYVSGRHVEGMFRTLDDIPIPTRFRYLFHHVSFRKDLSSTQLREG